MIYSDWKKIEIIMMKNQLRIASISSYEYWCYSLIPCPNIFMSLQVWPHLRFQANVLQFHFLHPSYGFAISLLEKAEEITLLPSVCLQTFPYISWLAIKYLIIIFDDLLFAMILLWISSLQSAHLHREHIWHQMNQNVEIGSLPICFNLLDNLFVFV